MSTKQRGDCTECKGTGREVCEHGKRSRHWYDFPGQKEKVMCNGGLTCLACGGSGVLRDQKRNK